MCHVNVFIFVIILEGIVGNVLNKQEKILTWTKHSKL